jgi:hypothetical protein
MSAAKTYKVEKREGNVRGKGGKEEIRDEKKKRIRQ